MRSESASNIRDSNRQELGPYVLLQALQHRHGLTVYTAKLNGESDDEPARLIKVSDEDEPGRADANGARLELEAELLGVIDSDVTVVPVNSGCFDGRTVLDFGRVDAVTIADLLMLRRPGNSRIGVGEAVRVILEALSAVDSMPLLHRHGQPATGLVCHGWGDATLVITSDGRVRSLGLSDVIVDGKRPAEWEWSALTAPEYCQPGPPIGGAADIYAAGALLFNLLTLRPVISGPRLSEFILRRMFRDIHPLPSDVFEDLAPFDAIVDRALKRDPWARYETARDFIDDLTATVREMALDVERDVSLSALHAEAHDAGIGLATGAKTAPDRQPIGSRATQIL